MSPTPTAGSVGSGWTRDAALPFALSALLLYGASLGLPLVTAAKFGERHSGYLLSGAAGLWHAGRWGLSAIVVICGVVAPLAFTALVAALAWAARRRPDPTWRPWLHLAARIEQWSMPEVHLLGIAVAFLKLSALVDTAPAAGLLCYGLAAALSLTAWRCFDPAPLARTGAVPATLRA